MLKFNTLEMRSIGSDEVNSVSARELYLDLGYSDANFTTWIKKNLIPDFIENQDYILLFAEEEQRKGSGGSNKKDYIITLDTAKHLALMSKTPKGKRIRQYFIKVEKVAKNLLGEEKLKLEIKKLSNEVDESYISGQIKIAKQLQELGCNFDPIALSKGELIQSKLPKSVGEAMSDAMSDIRVNVRPYSATYLLKKYEIGIRTNEWNDYLLEQDYLELYTFKDKTLKKWRDQSNWYGYNKFNSSIKELPYQVVYYEDRFLDLVQVMRTQGYID